MAHVVFLGLGFVVTVLGIAAYRPLAERFGIVAVPNERTLHAKATVRGGGVVVALVFLTGMGLLFASGELPARWFAALFVGGLVIALVGFVDDIVHLGTRVRLVVHGALGIWAVAWIGDLHLVGGGLGWLIYPISVVAVMWMINLFNFMDGIDGMAGSGALFLAVAAWLLADPSALSSPLLLLGVASAGFLVFNWPPAGLFMGDSGSGFLGYTFAVCILASVSVDQLSLCTWLVLLAYFLGDTTTTLLIRIATVDHWLGTHRSHAYQNLARVWDNHRRVTMLVIVFHLVWCLPLAIAATTWPSLGPVLVAIALAPPILLAAKYGPRYAG